MANALPSDKFDTSRHSIEHDCQHCEANQTGIWAMWEVLEKHNTDVITDAIYREIVALCESRGRVQGDRNAA